MRNTRKMKTVDFSFSKTPKILVKNRSFLDKSVVNKRCFKNIFVAQSEGVDTKIVA